MKCHTISLTHYDKKVHNSELFYDNAISQSLKVSRKKTHSGLMEPELKSLANIFRRIGLILGAACDIAATWPLEAV